MALISQKKSSGGFGKFLGLVVVVGLGTGGFMLWRQLKLPPPATVALETDLPAIGRKTTFTLKASEPIKGIESITVTADGAGLAKVPVPIAVTLPAPDATVTFVVGKEAFATLKPGSVTVEVTVQAKGTKLRTPAPIVVTKAFDVKLEPPALAATSQFIHPAQGGAEVVVYEVGPSSVKDGVQAGDWFFPGHPLPGGQPSQHFAFFAVPYDWDGVDEDQAKGKLLLVAEDNIGNRAQSSFVHKYFPRPMGKDTIELKDAFLQKVTGEIYARTPDLNKKGALVDDFLQLNGDLRKANMAELKALAEKSAPKFLWTTTFAPMANAAVKGSFADRRTYVYGGNKVDTQDHLGFDLASLEHAPIQAANAGTVVLARYFGIFGNCVVLDHGFGLMSLYAHLSTITVKDGDNVTPGQELGKTGATGLAGGDHLHFTLVLDGLPVSPIEWWDGHWIRDRLKLKLGDALPWQESAEGAMSHPGKKHRGK